MHRKQLLKFIQLTVLSGRMRTTLHDGGLRDIGDADRSRSKVLQRLQQAVSGDDEAVPLPLTSAALSAWLTPDLDSIPLSVALDAVQVRLRSDSPCIIVIVRSFA